MAIKINTAALENAAKLISASNKKISDDFSEVEKAIKNLSGYWHGSASEYGTGRLDYIKKSFFDVRYKTVEQIPTFLLNQAQGRYEEIENKVTSAADAFK